MKVRPGTFHFNSNRSQILVGPGTGIAPFRSFVSDLNAKQSTDAKSIVFFGCRSADKDFYFQDEWPTFSNCTLFTAFSRPLDETQKEYVQDKIKQFGEQVWHLLEDGQCKKLIVWMIIFNFSAQIFVAGRAKDMPDAVLEAIKEVAVVRGSCENTDDFVKELEKTGRLQFETWD